MQVDGILQTHPGVGSARRNLRGANRGIGNIAALSGFAQKQDHHLLRIPRCRTDLQAAPAKFGNSFQRARDQIRIVGQAFQLERHEFPEHLLHIVAIGRAVMHLFPLLGDGFVPRDRTDVHLLVGAHWFASLLDRNVHSLSPEHLNEHNCGREAAIVHCGACPVEYDGFDGTPVHSPKNKVHSLVLPPFTPMA